MLPLNRRLRVASDSLLSPQRHHDRVTKIHPPVSDNNNTNNNISSNNKKVSKLQRIKNKVLRRKKHKNMMFVPALLAQPTGGMHRSTSQVSTSSESSSLQSEDQGQAVHGDNSSNSDGTQTLRRVSSRPRLVSWDAFDANGSNDAQTSSQDGNASEELKRKHPHHSRLRHHHKNQRASSPPLPPTSDLERLLSDDIFSNVLSYLTADDAKSLLQTSHRLLNVTQKEYVWEEYLRKHLWPSILDDKNDIPLSTSTTSTTLMSASAVAPSEVSLKEYDQRSDEGACGGALPSVTSSYTLQKLYGMAWKKDLPTRVDESLFKVKLPGRRTLSIHQLKIVEVNGDDNSKDGSQLPAVQFVGRIGRGDRCVRANAPLPRPHGLTPSYSSLMSTSMMSSSAAVSRLLRQRLPNFPTMSLPWHKIEKGQPFVAPYYESSTSSWRMTPRWMSYFEITILPEPKEDADARRPDTRNFQIAPADHDAGAESQECVAIGLALKDFSMHHRMPGWDEDSYGWHSDDGGLFHGKGQMLRALNEHDDTKYGVGDTVGCGIDYYHRELFFTKNGRVVGRVESNQVESVWFTDDVYPVVGMDTHFLVQCNFGLSVQQPFQFDMEEYFQMKEQDLMRQKLEKQQHQVIHHQLMLNHSPLPHLFHHNR